MLSQFAASDSCNSKALWSDISNFIKTGIAQRLEIPKEELHLKRKKWQLGSLHIRFSVCSKQGALEHTKIYNVIEEVLCVSKLSPVKQRLGDKTTIEVEKYLPKPFQPNLDIIYLKFKLEVLIFDSCIVKLIETAILGTHSIITVPLLEDLISKSSANCINTAIQQVASGSFVVQNTNDVFEPTFTNTLSQGASYSSDTVQVTDTHTTINNMSDTDSLDESNSGNTLLHGAHALAQEENHSADMVTVMETDSTSLLEQGITNLAENTLVQREHHSSDKIAGQETVAHSSLQDFALTDDMTVSTPANIAHERLYGEVDLQETVKCLSLQDFTDTNDMGKSIPANIVAQSKQCSDKADVQVPDIHSSLLDFSDADVMGELTCANILTPKLVDVQQMLSGIFPLDELMPMQDAHQSSSRDTVRESRINPLLDATEIGMAGEDAKVKSVISAYKLKGMYFKSLAVIMHFYTFWNKRE